MSEIYIKKTHRFFWENWVQSFWGRGTFSSSPPWGAPFPHLTLVDFGPNDLDKFSFCWGGASPPPIWVRYGVWPVCTLAHFFSKFLPVILEFLSWSIVPTAYYRFWNFKESLIHVTQINFVQSSEKNAQSHFLGCERRKYSKSRGRYNGLMLKFSAGGAVMVRDRPHKVYEVE